MHRSGFFPRSIGVLLIAACFGYAADSLFILLDLPFRNMINLVALDLSDATYEGTVMAWLIMKNPKPKSFARDSLMEAKLLGKES